MSFSPALHGQLLITGGQTGTQLADTLTGDGITISNVTLNCPTGASGIFDGTASNIGIDQGVILTTGNISNAAGLNTTPNDFGTQNGGTGDPVLDFLAGSATADACALEFDIVSTCDIIQIAYVFASEEYPNFVGQIFNDIFAFIITGPGLPPGGKNIALIPNTITPVAINTVNAGMNNVYYVANPPGAGTTVKYNGFTTPLLAITKIEPCQTYHLKLVIADGGDDTYDSGVFLDLGGIKCFQNRTSLQAEYSITASSNAVEGCNDVLVNVFRTGDSTQAKTVDFSVSGTATTGADYTGMPASLVFPPFGDSLGFMLNIPNDAVIEGTEFIEIVVRDSLCNVLTTDTLRIPIEDPPEIDAGNDTTVCVNSTLTINAIPGTAGGSIAWSPTANLNDATAFDPVFTPPGPGTYTFSTAFTDDIGCTADDNITITVPPFTPAISSTNVDCNGAGNGTATATITGTAPYTFLWLDSGNNTLQSNTNTTGTDALPNLAPGTYQVVITDGEGCFDTLMTTITEPVAPLSGIIANQVDLICNGDPTGSVSVTASGGTPPYQYAIDGNPFGISNVFNGLAAGPHTLSIQDSNNCLFNIPITLTEPPALASSILIQKNVDCNGNATGAVTIGASGGTGPYQFSLNGGVQSPDSSFTALSAGNYTITIEDANGCIRNQIVTITEPSPVGGVIVSQTNVDCNGNATGSFTINGSGGVGPYLF
ncbi:MAG: choice-of-anchor L domain-containing protein [Bacteroidota bacterium]